MGKRRRRSRPDGSMVPGQISRPAAESSSSRSGRTTAQRLLQFEFSQQLFQRNFEELEVFLRYYLHPSVALPILALEERWRSHEGVLEITFLLHNFLASAKSLIDHARVFYNDVYAPRGLMPKYGEEIKARFTTHPLSQFVQELRNMSLHYHLPSLSRRWRQTVVGGRGGLLESSVALKRSDLAIWRGWNPPATEFLESAGEEIELLDVASAYHAHVAAFYTWFRAEQEQIHGRAPAAYSQLVRLGLHTNSSSLIAEIERRLGELELQAPESFSFDAAAAALEPVLTSLDMRVLMFCRYDRDVWLAQVVSRIERRFKLTTEFRQRILTMGQVRGASSGEESRGATGSK